MIFSTSYRPADSPPRVRPKSKPRGKPTGKRPDPGKPSTAAIICRVIITVLIVTGTLAFIVCGGILTVLLKGTAGGFREMSRPKLAQKAT